MHCQIRWCKKETEALIAVNENIGDGSFRVAICLDCAETLGLKPGDDLPEPETVRKILTESKKGGDQLGNKVSQP